MASRSRTLFSQLGRFTKKRAGRSYKIFCPARSFREVFRGTVVGKRGFCNESQEEGFSFLCWRPCWSASVFEVGHKHCRVTNPR